ncbi:hypothetical protein cyc_01190 [Cyclospora cayetanensis]|uniref:DNA mismatch repair protein MutS-like N-terminal domain-containing protein n=1 Tax=Cyclospora cayetanensis TaxID=88456 RepID=A0A1D3CUJ1_9EIME|nr:hypothetical protein cyc_01190 [Cyclospora cayetanensis]
MPCSGRVRGPPWSFTLFLLRVALLLLGALSLEAFAMGGCTAPARQGPPQRIAGERFLRPLRPVWTARQALLTCFQCILPSSDCTSPHRCRYHQQRSYTLFRRSSAGSRDSENSPRKYPLPLSASDLGVSSGAPLVSSVFLSRLARLGRPLAKRLLPQLSFSNPLMLPEGVGMTALMQFVEKQKVLHKDHVILTQVGDFYEAYGVDAVMLVEFCGLNPMGGKPKAGCPKGSVQAVLDCLTAERYLFWELSYVSVVPFSVEGFSPGVL